MFKQIAKRVIPPTTSMVDARLCDLKRENDELRMELTALRRELSDAMRYMHADVCADKLAPKRDASKIRPFVLSVATYAPRFESIAKVFRSLCGQSVLPVETHVWIPRKDAPEGLASLPHEVMSAFTEWGGGCPPLG